MVGVRRSWAAAVVVGLTAAWWPVTARAGSDHSQVVRGEVSAPTGPVTVGPVWADVCELSDAVATFSAGLVDTFGHDFGVAPATRGTGFTLIPDRPADLDVVFRGPGGAQRAYESRGLDGERGRVPAWATRATVCLSAGATAGFVYRAGPSARSTRHQSIPCASGCRSSTPAVGSSTAWSGSSTPRAARWEGAHVLCRDAIRRP